ncbi:MAG TPA: hypothetical protein VLK26_06895 [Rudaea sp.]|nr:hypothetical protein [Rudaea sp.]
MLAYFLSLWAIVLGFLQVMPQTGAVVHMRLSSPAFGTAQRFQAQWYYDRGKGPTSPWFSEAESVSAFPAHAESEVTFKLPTGIYRGLRFDPINGDAAVRILSMQWDLPNGESASETGLDNLAPLANIKSMSRNGGGVEITPVPGTSDPQTQLAIASPISLAVPLQSFPNRLAMALEISALAFLAGWLLLTRVGIRLLVVSGMVSAAVLILAMMVASSGTMAYHPDEPSHVASYAYYVDHWLPPAVDDPATIPSTSVWGYSYLFELDVVYDIAAHATQQLREWTDDPVFSARVFQLGLWAILCALALFRRYWTWVLCALLLSPQIWYVFSYFNADAFPLFLSMIAAGLVADEKNALHEHLSTGSPRRVAYWMAVVCIGLLLMSKRNYLPATAAFVLWLAVIQLDLRARVVIAGLCGLLLLGIATFIADVPAMAHWHMPLSFAGIALAAGAAALTGRQCWKDKDMRLRLLRLTCFVTLCVSIALPRLAWDVHVNGWPAQKAERIHAVVEARAGQDFRPSVIAQGHGYATSGLAAKGVPLLAVVFEPYGWLRSSLASAFGVYGYMNVVAPTWLYVGLIGFAIGLLLVVLNRLRQIEPEHWLALTSIVVGSCALVMASSLLLSWVGSLEAQGRYLFPALAIFALALGKASPRLRGKTAIILIASAWLLSFYSFACVALPAFARG